MWSNVDWAKRRGVLMVRIKFMWLALIVMVGGSNHRITVALSMIVPGR